MKRRFAGRLARAGQGMVEYAILLVLMASIVIAVLAVAGNELNQAFTDIKYDLTTLGGGPSLQQPYSCPDGTTAVWRHSKYRCKDN